MEKRIKKAYNPNGDEILNIPLSDQGAIRNRIIKKTADFYKAINNGIKQSTNKKIRVLAPSMGSVSDTPGVKNGNVSDSWWQKPTLRDANYYMNGMYNFIVNLKHERVQDYFQGLNNHPYIFDSYSTGFNENYMFWSKDDTYSFDKILATDGGEANFGFIAKEKTLKNWGKAL